MKITIDGELWRVWFEHHPEWQFGHGDQNMTTMARIGHADADVATLGWSTCSPRDTFSRAKGRKVALARALKVGGFTKEQRTQVWLQLFAKGMKP